MAFANHIQRAQQLGEARSFGRLALLSTIRRDRMFASCFPARAARREVVAAWGSAITGDDAYYARMFPPWNYPDSHNSCFGRKSVSALERARVGSLALDPGLGQWT